MSDTVGLFIRMDKDLKDQLEQVAAIERRSMTFVAVDIIRAGLAEKKTVDADLVAVVQAARQIA
tara:strand:+ start:377 stop:568 length:192 start_codon:yes stop_codon:yes gene_type:complete